MFEGVTTVAFLAGRLRRAGVGIGGLVLPLRDPRLFAKQVATLHELSGRRLTIAPAIGGHEVDFRIMQRPFERRGRLMDEYLAVLHAIFYGEHPVSFAGPSVAFENATLYPKPVGLRIWITGESEPAWARVVRWGAGWFTSYPAVDDYRAKLAQLRDTAARAGRDPDSIETAATMFVCIAESREAAMRICERSLLNRFGSLERGLARSIVGGAAEVADGLARRYEAGLRYLELKFWAHTPAQFMEMMSRVAADVLPAVRALGTRGG